MKAWFEVSRNVNGSVVLTRVEDDIPQERTTMGPEAARWVAEQLWRAAYEPGEDPRSTSVSPKEDT